MVQASQTLTGEQALAAASAFYKAGLFGESERLYRAILAANPGHSDSLLAVGNLCLKRNAPQEAIAPLEKALALKPDSAETHNDLGMALALLGRHEEALPRFEGAIALSPDFATAHTNLGNTLVALDRQRDAVACFQRAIALEPGDALAEFNLAGMLSKNDRHVEAVLHYHKALEHKPDWVNALCGLAYCLNMSDCAEEALRQYERALALNPEHAAAHHGLGVVKQVLGRLEKSQAAFRKAVELAPQTPSYHRALAEAKRFRAGDPQIAKLEELAAELASFAEEEQTELHFALGKAYGDTGRHDDAFRHLIAGNTIKRRLEPFDEPAHVDMMQHITRVFTAELLARTAGNGDPSEAPVFILGMPRSGSTLIEQILASHPRIHGGGELRYLGEDTKTFRGADINAFFPEVVKFLTSEQLRAFGARYVEQVRALAPTANRVTDKMPFNFRFIGLIRMVLPNAKIIHTRRDPVDTCISCFSRLFGKKSFTSDLGTLGRYYRSYAALMDHWRSVLPPGAMLEVQYEDLVGDFENQARRIIDYCGVEWNDRCLTFHQTERPVRTASVTQVRQPIYRDAIGRWKPNESVLKPLIDALDGVKR